MQIEKYCQEIKQIHNMELKSKRYAGLETENGHQTHVARTISLIQLFVPQFKCTREDGLQFTHFWTIQECGT